MLKVQDFVIRTMLVKGLITPADVERAREGCDGAEESLIDALIAGGVVTGRDVAIIRAMVCEAPFLDLDHFEINPFNASELPREIAESHTAFPLFIFEEGVVVGMADPMDYRGLDAIRRRMEREVDVVLCDRDALSRLISRAYRRGFDSTDDSGAAEEKRRRVDTSDPVVATVEDILGSAIDEGASDIHINPDDEQTHVRFRIDGVLRTRPAPPKSMHEAIVRRLKVLAGLDLTQTRKPQDGKCPFQHGAEEFDLRMSVIPTIWGENIVIRVLRRAVEIKSFGELGMDPGVTEQIEDCLSRPHGMLLVTGPTGSGKTTTLYTALAGLNTPERNIMTIEDPVEIRLPMIRQTQVNAEVGLTFATALRTILRQDPDIVLVGEIRDAETAQIAVQAALTGHLVLSTLHTNDATGAVARLRDFNVPSFAIASGLVGVMAQRLIRRLCSKCAERASVSERELKVWALEPADAARLREGGGCGACMHTGYRGRVGVYEFLRITPALRGMIAADATPQEIAEGAQREGLRPMWRDALDKALEGQTTLEELARVRSDEGTPAPSTAGDVVPMGAAA